MEYFIATQIYFIICIKNFEISGEGEHNDENCAMIQKENGKWMDRKCDETHPFVCKRHTIKTPPYTPSPPITTIPDGKYSIFSLSYFLYSLALMSLFSHIYYGT